MTATLGKIVILKNGHEMTELNLNGLIRTMCSRLADVGLSATGTINLPDSDILLTFTSYDAEGMRHALHHYRYKIVNLNGIHIQLNLY